MVASLMLFFSADTIVPEAIYKAQVIKAQAPETRDPRVPEFRAVGESGR